MSTFDEKDTQAQYGYPASAERSSASTWIVVAIIAAVAAGTLWLAVGGPTRVGPSLDQPAIQHTTQPPAPTASPAEPTTTPKP